MSNKHVKQDALDNLADALTEDILNTPDDELLREVEEDYGDPRALANKFDQILEPIREVSIHDEDLATRRFSMMRIMARWMNAATVLA